MSWSAAIILLLVAYAAIRVVRGAPWRERRPGPDYTCIECANPRGWGTVRKWAMNTEPDHYPQDGASHLAPYVERLFASTNSFVTLSFDSPGGDRGASLWKERGEPSVHLMFESPKDLESEDRARALFASQGVKPIEDSLGEDGWRALSWPAPGDAQAATALCREVLRDVCRVSDEEPLDITYEEDEFTEP